MQEDEKGKDSTRTPGGMQEELVINEPPKIELSQKSEQGRR